MTPYKSDSQHEVDRFAMAMKLAKQKKQRREDYVALDCQVLAVAVEGQVEDWSAYIGAVEGNSHEEEYHDVARSGTKLQREIAELLFPSFKDLRWRD